MSKIEFTTTQYEFSHGTKPKGFGNWLFSVETFGGAKKEFGALGTFSQAKAKVSKTARLEFPIQSLRISVLP